MMEQYLAKWAKGENILMSNNKILDALGSPLTMIGRMTGSGTGRGMSLGAAAGSVYKNAEGQLNWGNIAGSYIGASAVYRGLSGGGAYRDASGNTNLIGVPFV